MEETLAILKPDIVRRKLMGKAIHEIEKKPFTISQMKYITLSKEQTAHFYQEHKEKPFFETMINFMCSGPCLILVLSGENAINEWRKFIGHTNPHLADPKTLRSMFGISIDENSFHGSDSSSTAIREISLLFPKS